MSAIHCSHVSFSYTTAVPIVDDASFDLGAGWCGLVGANGAGKSTLLALMAGQLTPDSGSLTIEPSGLRPVICPQRVDAVTDAIDSFAESWERRAVRLRSSLHLERTDLERWDTLSPGERKRWQVGAALAEDPAVLLLDEPTNHLDEDATDLLVSSLQRFRGCGVIVSHDRSVLRDLTTRTLRLADARAELWNGSYAEALAGWTARDQERRAHVATMKAEQKKLTRRISDQRQKSQQKDAERIRERRAATKRDLDTRGSAATYRHERGQKTGPQTVSSMARSLDKVNAELARAELGRELGGSVSFASGRADKEFLIRYRGPVCADDRRLFDVDVEVRRGDRIHIAGANGAGKTSLLTTMLDAASCPADRIVQLAQETSAAESASRLDEVRALAPDSLGRVMSLVALLGSDPRTLLASDQPSPGEARKLALAAGLSTETWLLALDEPTNHLDLPSIERLQEAIGAYEGALLLITHDDALSRATTDITWTVGPDGIT